MNPKTAKIVKFVVKTAFGFVFPYVIGKTYIAGKRASVLIDDYFNDPESKVNQNV